MKRLIFTLIASVMMIAAFAKDKAEITFKTTEHDFGYIKEDGGSVSCEFEFTNTGNKPLIIIEAVASEFCFLIFPFASAILRDSTVGAPAVKIGRASCRERV